jgi:hypothetical protein
MTSQKQLLKKYSKQDLTAACTELGINVTILKDKKALLTAVTSKTGSNEASAKHIQQSVQRRMSNATDPESLKKLTKQQLIAIGQKRGITVKKSHTKKEILRLLTGEQVNEDPLATKTVSSLRNICKENGWKIPSKIRKKNDIIKFVKQKQTEISQMPPEPEPIPKQPPNAPSLSTLDEEHLTKEPVAPANLKESPPKEPVLDDLTSEPAAKPEVAPINRLASQQSPGICGIDGTDKPVHRVAGRHYASDFVPMNDVTWQQDSHVEDSKEEKDYDIPLSPVTDELESASNQSTDGLSDEFDALSDHYNDDGYSDDCDLDDDSFISDLLHDVAYLDNDPMLPGSAMVRAHKRYENLHGKDSKEMATLNGKLKENLRKVDQDAWVQDTELVKSLIRTQIKRQMKLLADKDQL